MVWSRVYKHLKFIVVSVFIISAVSCSQAGNDSANDPDTVNTADMEASMEASTEANMEARDEDNAVESPGTYYVSPDGDDSWEGTEERPFKTLQKAVVILNPGDTVLVKDGVYKETFELKRSGKADSWITIRSINRHGAKILPDYGYSAVMLHASYIIFDGFEVKAIEGHGIESVGNHHTVVKNCYAHHCGAAGIVGFQNDYMVIENNITCFNAFTNEWQCSGISICSPVAFDKIPGFHFIVRNNISYGNDVHVPHPEWKYSDGNGIIIDVFRNNGYKNGALVENNLAYYNGGRGIHVFMSDNVTVRNNTCYKNIKNREIASARCDMDSYDSSNCTFINNIVYSGGFDNTYAVQDHTSKNNVWKNNLFYNGKINRTNSSAVIDETTGNIFDRDPLFVDEGQDFRLQQGSPAIDAGTAEFDVPGTDLDNTGRPADKVDIGCYEYR